MEIKHWLIVYDIRDAKRLGKVEKIMASYAYRVQKSVFEANAPEQVIDQLKLRLNSTIEAEEDFILFFNICERDWQKQQKYGLGAKGKEQMPDDGFMIL